VIGAASGVVGGGGEAAEELAHVGCEQVGRDDSGMVLEEAKILQSLPFQSDSQKMIGQ
jgi:hypothetical protein